jgi:malonyl-CoA decarboxylase
LRGWAREELAKPRRNPELEALRVKLAEALSGEGAAPSGLADVFAGLTAWYLSREWSSGAVGHVIDPVARFHLGNGARLERINGAADTSPRGLQQSLGVMVNYVYDLGDVEANHEQYFTRHHAVCSGAVQRAAQLVEPLMLDVESR